MAEKFNDGGPMFQQLDVKEVESALVGTHQGGATLWDFYAAAALSTVNLADQPGYALRVAVVCGDYADAMIAEREKRHAQS